VERPKPGALLSIPVTAMPIPIVMTMLVRDICVSAVPVSRHTGRFGTAWHLAKAVGIRGRVRTVIWHTLRHGDRAGAQEHSESKEN
jgi:hypothetical protein